MDTSHNIADFCKNWIQNQTTPIVRPLSPESKEALDNEEKCTYSVPDFYFDDNKLKKVEKKNEIKEPEMVALSESHKETEEKKKKKHHSDKKKYRKDKDNKNDKKDKKKDKKSKKEKKEKKEKK